MEQLGSSQADHILFHFIFSSFSFLPTLLASLSKQRSWEDFLDSFLFCFHSRIFMKPFWTAAEKPDPL